MLKKIGLIIVLIISIHYICAKEEEYVITCPAIKNCSPSYSSKQNMQFADIDQQSYECFRDYGEMDLAHEATTARTKCLVIYGSTTATINGKPISDDNSRHLPNSKSKM